MADLSKLSRFLQPPKAKLSEHQWRTLMKRHMDQSARDTLREGRIPMELQEDILKYAAPGEEEVGRLVRPPGIPSGSRDPVREGIEKMLMERKMAAAGAGGAEFPQVDKVIDTLPIGQARAKWAQSAENLSAGRPGPYVGYTQGKIPPTEELRLGATGGPQDLMRFTREAEQPSSMLPEYVLPGIDYSKLKLGQVEPGMATARRAAEKGLVEARVGPAAVKGTKPTEKETGVAVQMASVASEIWKDIGDFRTTSGKDWRRLWETAPGGKRNYASAKEFFIAQFLKWQEKPDSIKNPYIKRLIGAYWENWNKATQ